MQHRRRLQERCVNGKVAQFVEVLDNAPGMDAPLVVKSTDVTVDKAITNAALHELDVLLHFQSMEKTKQKGAACIVHYVKHELVGATLQIWQEYCAHGDLLGLVQQETRLQKAGFAASSDGLIGASEDSVRRVFRQLVSGVAFMHECGIAHLDLSLENVFMAQDGGIRIGDFEHAVRFDACPNVAIGNISKATYAAPELHAAVVAMVPVDVTKADIWSLGVILWMLWAKTPLVSHASRRDPLFRQMQDTGVLRALLGTRRLGQASLELCDLLRRLLDPNPDSRVSMTELLRHPWLTQDHQSSISGSKTISNRVVLEDQKRRIRSASIGTAQCIRSEIALVKTRVPLRSSALGA